MELQILCRICFVSQMNMPPAKRLCSAREMQQNNIHLDAGRLDVPTTHRRPALSGQAENVLQLPRSRPRNVSRLAASKIWNRIYLSTDLAGYAGTLAVSGPIGLEPILAAWPAACPQPKRQPAIARAASPAVALQSQSEPELQPVSSRWVGPRVRAHWNFKQSPNLLCTKIGFPDLNKSRNSGSEEWTNRSKFLDYPGNCLVRTISHNGARSSCQVG